MGSDFNAIKVLYTKGKLPKVFRDLEAGKKLTYKNLSQLIMYANGRGDGNTDHLTKAIVSNFNNLSNLPIKLDKEAAQKLLSSVRYDVFMNGVSEKIGSRKTFTTEQKHIFLDTEEILLVGLVKPEYEDLQKYKVSSEWGLQFKLVTADGRTTYFNRFKIKGSRTSSPLFYLNMPLE